VVPSVSVASAGSVPSRVTEEGETVQAAFGGAPAQESATGKSNPLTGESASVKRAVWPAPMEAWEGEPVIVKSSNFTVRGSIAVSVLPVVEVVPEVEATALEIRTIVPVTEKLSNVEVTLLRLPTVSVLDSPGVIVAVLKEHVAGAMLAQPRAIDPVNPAFVEADTVNVTCPVPARTLTAVGSAESEKGGPPAPVKTIVCGLSAAVSVITTDPTRVPVDEGRNVTVRVQAIEGLTTLPQLLDSLYSP